MMTVTEKIALLRDSMRKHQLDAYIIPSTDPHQSEYVADHWQARQWISGFTGSAGTVVITYDFAGLWTDSRYFIQAENELANSEMKLMKLIVPHTAEYIDWINKTLQAGSRIGIDGTMWSTLKVQQMKRSFGDTQHKLITNLDLVSPLWRNRPSLPTHGVFEHEVLYAGMSRNDKLQLIREDMLERKADYHFLASLDDIAWTFNLRGTDIDYSPVTISYALIGQRKATLFIDAQKLSPDFKQSLWTDGVSVAPYHAVSQILSAISSDKSIWYDPASLNYQLFSKLHHQLRKIEAPNIPGILKAQKNDVEAQHIRETMVKDGVALVRFLMWLEREVPGKQVSEIGASEKLFQFRSEQEGFQGESFGTIAGYREHGAIVHYSATAESDVTLEPDGLFLLDSGGHYLGGTTDITRTIALGLPTTDEKLDFTYVLKGHIQLAMAVFPEGTKGFQLDTLARMPLWRAGLNYGHGTGHGVGYFLNVHEGPQRISPAPTPAPETVFKPGMLTSNEPGLYREGMHGIRTESLMLCVPAGQSEYGRFLKFETVTLCPIDIRLIEVELLNSEELNWLNNYHNRVFEQLAPQLTDEEVVWLHKRTLQL